MALPLVLAMLIGGFIDGRPILPPAPGTHVVTYRIEATGQLTAGLDYFGEMVAAALGDPRGWAVDGVLTFREVDDAADADLTVVLAAPDEVAAAAPICSARFSCRVGDRALINHDRYLLATQSWTKSRAEYRAYVVNHEVGHWLGLGHTFPCPAPGAPAPVMLQQSKSMDGCTARVWPLRRERQAVMERWRDGDRGGSGPPAR